MKKYAIFVLSKSLNGLSRHKRTRNDMFNKFFSSPKQAIVVSSYYDSDEKGYFLDVEVFEGKEKVIGYVSSSINKQNLPIGAVLNVRKVKEEVVSGEVVRHYQLA